MSANRKPFSLVQFAALVLLATAPLTTPAQSGAEASYSRRGADSCLACHEEQLVLAIFRTKHAVPSDARGPFGHGQLQCEACHGPGGKHGGRVRRGQPQPKPEILFGADTGATGTPAAAQNAPCLGCHDADAGMNWHGGAHQENDVSCAGCHKSHAPRDPVLTTSTQSDVCYGCHQLQRTTAYKAYSHPLDEGKMDCGGCHDPHGSNAEFQLVRATLNDTCYQCHAEKRGPFLWEHAPVPEDCSTCHAAHGSNHPGMLTRRGPTLCQSCHSQAGHPSVAYDTDGLASNMPSQYLLAQNCMNCHAQVHGSNHPSGSRLMR